MTELERPLSALSIASSSHKSELDWDHRSQDSLGPATPSPRRRLLNLPDSDGTPRAQPHQRSLADLLRLHAEKGQEDMTLTPEEERRLRDALDTWVSHLSHSMHTILDRVPG